MRLQSGDGGSTRQQREWRRRNALSLAHEHPDVEQIIIEMGFSRIAQVGYPLPQTHRLFPGAYAFFEFACPYHDCVDGGFDFTSALLDILAIRSTQSTGHIVCRGWKDQQRANAPQCLLECHFHITVHYV